VSTFLHGDSFYIFFTFASFRGISCAAAFIVSRPVNRLLHYVSNTQSLPYTFVLCLSRHSVAMALVITDVYLHVDPAHLHILLELCFLVTWRTFEAYKWVSTRVPCQPHGLIGAAHTKRHIQLKSDTQGSGPGTVEVQVTCHFTLIK
jgi:hypothetical protein